MQVSCSSLCDLIWMIKLLNGSHAAVDQGPLYLTPRLPQNSTDNNNSAVCFAWSELMTILFTSESRERTHKSHKRSFGLAGPSRSSFSFLFSLFSRYLSNYISGQPLFLHTCMRFYLLAVTISISAGDGQSSSASHESYGQPPWNAIIYLLLIPIVASAFWLPKSSDETCLIINRLHSLPRFTGSLGHYCMKKHSCLYLIIVSDKFGCYCSTVSVFFLRPLFAFKISVSVLSLVFVFGPEFEQLTLFSRFCRKLFDGWVVENLRYLFSILNVFALWSGCEFVCVCVCDQSLWIIWTSG